jgi:hypothetical protein
MNEGKKMVEAKIKARKRSGITDDQAEILYKEFEKIREKDGRLTAAGVVKRAKNNRSTLHRFFEWGEEAEKKAFENYLLRRAGQLIRSIHVVIIHDAGIDPGKRLFIKVRDDIEEEAKKKAIYVTQGEVDDNEEYKRQVVMNAKRDLKAWLEDYEIYDELAPVIHVIKDFLESVITDLPAIKAHEKVQSGTA